MRRKPINQNFQTNTTAQVSGLTPLGFVEVVPGDTFSGTLEVNCKSATTVGVVGNRAYLDLYAFYCPYRILWEGFPDFLTKGEGSLPTVSNLCEIAFETKFTTTPAAGAFTELVPFQRRCMNICYDRFFKRAVTADYGLDNNSVVTTFYRPSTFHEAIPEGADEVTTTIDTSGPP